MSSGKHDPQTKSLDIFGVVVSMKISREGKEVETKTIDFGKMGEDQLKGLTELFSMMASNIETIKKLEPQFEKLDKSKPSYSG
jgi:hypothetical protein